jgi:hypothetical protein
MVKATKLKTFGELNKTELAKLAGLVGIVLPPGGLRTALQAAFDINAIRAQGFTHRDFAKIFPPPPESDLTPQPPSEDEEDEEEDEEVVAPPAGAMRRPRSRPTPSDDESTLVGSLGPSDSMSNASARRRRERRRGGSPGYEHREYSLPTPPLSVPPLLLGIRHAPPLPHPFLHRSVLAHMDIGTRHPARLRPPRSASATPLGFGHPARLRPPRSASATPLGICHPARTLHHSSATSLPSRVGIATRGRSAPAPAPAPAPLRSRSSSSQHALRVRAVLTRRRCHRSRRLRSWRSTGLARCSPW